MSSFEMDVFQAMGTGNTDRIELKMMIMNHRTFCCPLSGVGLDVDRSIAFDVTEGAKTSTFGPFDPSAKLETPKGKTPILEYFETVGMVDGVTVRVIKG